MSKDESARIFDRWWMAYVGITAGLRLSKNMERTDATSGEPGRLLPDLLTIETARCAGDG